MRAEIAYKPPGRWLPWKARLSWDASQFAGITADAAEQMYSREHASHSGHRTEAPRAAAPLRRLPPPAYYVYHPLLFFLILPHICFVSLFGINVFLQLAFFAKIVADFSLLWTMLC